MTGYGDWDVVTDTTLAQGRIENDLADDAAPLEQSVGGAARGSRKIVDQDWSRRGCERRA